MVGTKWIDKGDGRIMTFINAAKYIPTDSVVKDKDIGKYATVDVVLLIDNLTGATIALGVAVFFLRFKPFAIQPVPEDKAEDAPTIN